MAAIVIERETGEQTLLLPFVTLGVAEGQAWPGRGLHFLIAQLIGNLQARGEGMFEQRGEHLMDVPFGRVDMAQPSQRGDPFEGRALLQQRNAITGEDQAFGNQERRQEVHLFSAAAQESGQRPLAALLTKQAQNEPPRLAIVPSERQPLRLAAYLDEAAAGAGDLRHDGGCEGVPQAEAGRDGFVRAVGHPVRVHRGSGEQAENVTVHGIRQ